MSYKVAVVGATGNVGREMVNILAERKFPFSEVVALASAESQGKQISCGDKVLTVKNLNEYNFEGTDVVLAAGGSEVSKDICQRIQDAGSVMIDNASAFRMDKDVPLVVPEINPQDIAHYKKKNIIANPNCSTIQLAVVLKPLHDMFKAKRLVISTYQATSGKGKKAMDELYWQTKKIYENDSFAPSEFPKPIAFNCIPQVDVFMEDGDTKEEWKMANEIKKIFNDDSIALTSTCVRVPVFNCHSQAVNIEFEKEFDLEAVIEMLDDVPGITIASQNKDGAYKTPTECSKEDNVFVSRLRRDKTLKNGLNMWTVTDNLRKGAALNAVQIAEILISDYL